MVDLVDIRIIKIENKIDVLLAGDDYSDLEYHKLIDEMNELLTY